MFGTIPRAEYRTMGCENITGSAVVFVAVDCHGDVMVAVTATQRAIAWGRRITAWAARVRKMFSLRVRGGCSKDCSPQRCAEWGRSKMLALLEFPDVAVLAEHCQSADFRVCEDSPFGKAAALDRMERAAKAIGTVCVGKVEGTSQFVRFIQRIESQAKKEESYQKLLLKEIVWRGGNWLCERWRLEIAYTIERAMGTPVLDSGGVSSVMKDETEVGAENDNSVFENDLGFLIEDGL